MSNLISTINGPADLKRLTTTQLQQLAGEIRQFLLETVAHNGGHLAPNLGVVELTLALHATFNSPQDQIIWDVGHQSYVHKVITGRRDAFATLRQYHGISGFPKPEESRYDAFGTGHSSTSISAAIGMAKARDLSGGRQKIIAVIGDGSLTGGMAFEALNHLGQLQTNLMIVLNDNEMSISKNVGALAHYLTKLRTNPRLRRLKSDLQELIQKIPRVGQATVRYLEKLEDGLSFLVIPGMFFEELGITYVGPIDGHNLNILRTTLRDAAQMQGPILVHVLTKKGKGYRYAEANPQRFHGVGPFQLDDGVKLDHAVGPTYTDVFGATILDLAGRDSRIVAITAAMAAGTGLLPFARKFPDRFIDVGIAEQHAVTLAAGLAKQGFRPVVAIYSTFMQRAFDQIIHDVCLQNLPVLLMLDRAGLVGPDGPTHHGVFDLSFLRQIPNLTLMAPYDDREFRDMIYTALQLKAPVAIRYPRRNALHVKEAHYQLLPLGKSSVLQRGAEVALVAVGTMVGPALAAAQQLQSSGINCTVVNARFVKPLDEMLLLELAANHRLIVTLEENILAGGFGAAVLELFAREQVTQVKCVPLGIPDRFVTHGATEILLRLCGLDCDSICREIQGRFLN
ncbi:MAG: 1-deoxy-D-xylulose-5-phosphate synthase [Bacillota bacterium]|jgi:1-deoxy-D-xylulose-5-phosphate synthase